MVAFSAVVQELGSLRGMVGVGGWNCKIVFLGALPIHLFRHFCCSMYRLVTIHSAIDGRTDRQSAKNCLYPCSSVEKGNNSVQFKFVFKNDTIGMYLNRQLLKMLEQRGVLRTWRTFSTLDTELTWCCCCCRRRRWSYDHDGYVM